MWLLLLFVLIFVLGAICGIVIKQYVDVRALQGPSSEIPEDSGADEDFLSY
jgi:uncharacterized membrane protein YoaK (UPF0700 family)